MCVRVLCVSADVHVPCCACGSRRITFGSSLFSSAIMAPGNLIQVVWLAQWNAFNHWRMLEALCQLEIFIFILCTCVWRPACMHMHHMCVCAYGEQKRILRLLGQDLQLLWTSRRGLCQGSMSCKHRATSLVPAPTVDFSSLPKDPLPLQNS